MTDENKQNGPQEATGAPESASDAASDSTTTGTPEGATEALDGVVVGVTRTSFIVARRAWNRRASFLSVPSHSFEAGTQQRCCTVCGSLVPPDADRLELSCEFEPLDESIKPEPWLVSAGYPLIRKSTVCVRCTVAIFRASVHSIAAGAKKNEQSGDDNG